MLLHSKMFTSAVLLLCVSSWQHCVAEPGLVRYSSQPPTGILFSVRSRRDPTGQCVSKVEVKDESGEELNPDVWTVDVQNQTRDCVGEGCSFVESYVVSPASKPPYGYELFPGVGYYRFHAEARTWVESLLVCESEGTHLAIINSAREASALKTLFARYNNTVGSNDKNIASVGFSDILIEGEFLTIFGQPLSRTGYNQWAPGEPNNSGYNGEEDCGSINRDALLNDATCALKYAFICELEL